MQVKVFPYLEKIGMGNIVWADRDRGSAYYRVSKYAGRNGRFTLDHPAAPGAPCLGISAGGAQVGDSASLKAFRERGYWASCFPEGDGITWKPLHGQSDEQCITDIRECFGWDISPAV